MKKFFMVTIIDYMRDKEIKTLLCYSTEKDLKHFIVEYEKDNVDYKVYYVAVNDSTLNTSINEVEVYMI